MRAANPLDVDPMAAVPLALAATWLQVAEQSARDSREALLSAKAPLTLIDITMALHVLSAANRTLLAAVKEIANQVSAIGDAVSPDPEDFGP